MALRMSRVLHVVVICIIVHLPAAGLASNGRSNLQRAFANYDFAKVIALGMQDESLLSHSPSAVYAFCTARFSSVATDACFEGVNVSQGSARLYGEALFDVWLTRPAAFADHLSKLAEISNGRAWYLLAKAESESFHKSMIALGQTLDELNGLRLDAETLEFVTSIRVDMLMQAGDWASIRRILAKRSTSQVELAPVLAAAQIALLLRAGRSDKARRFVADIRAQDPSAYYGQVLAARLGFVLEGVDSALQTYELAQRDREGPPELQLEHGLVLLSADDSTGWAKGEALVQMALRRERFRADSVLATSLWLVRYRQQEFASRLMYNLTRLPDWQEAREAFTDVHTLGAWEAVFKGEVPLATQLLQHALAEAPRDFEANWLRYLVCKKADEPICIGESLTNLVAVDSLAGEVREAVTISAERFPSDKVLIQLRRQLPTRAMH